MRIIRDSRPDAIVAPVVCGFVVGLAVTVAAGPTEIDPSVVDGEPSVGRSGIVGRSSSPAFVPLPLPEFDPDGALVTVADPGPDVPEPDKPDPDEPDPDEPEPDEPEPDEPEPDEPEPDEPEPDEPEPDVPEPDGAVVTEPEPEEPEPEVPVPPDVPDPEPDVPEPDVPEPNEPEPDEPEPEEPDPELVETLSDAEAHCGVAIPNNRTVRKEASATTNR